MTKREAIRKAQQLRAEGKNAKVFCRSGVYTRPGLGIVPFIEYFVKVL